MLRSNKKLSARQFKSKIHRLFKWKFLYTCSLILAGYLRSRNEQTRGIHVACKALTRENFSCLAKFELCHYSVDFYPNVYIYCGTQENNQWFDNTEDRREFYPKCKVKFQNESNVLRRKRKPVVESDLKNKD